MANVESTKISRENDRRAKRNAITLLSQQRDSLRPDVERMQTRNEAIEKLKLYEIKLIVTRCEEAQASRDRKQLEVDEINTLLVRAREAIIPLESNLRDLKRQQQNRDKGAEVAKKNIQSEETHLRGIVNATTTLDQEIDNTSREIEAIMTERRKDEEKLERLRKELESKEADLGT